MQTIERPSQVFDAIVGTLRAAIAAGNYSAAIDVADYESWGPHSVADRQLLIEFGEMEPTPGENDGRHGQHQEIVIYVVISTVVPKAAREAANLASALTRKMRFQRWGLLPAVIDKPIGVRASPAFFVRGNEGAKGFEAWEIRFHQLIKYGSDQWPDDEGLEGAIALAINPVNPDDPGEYKNLE